MTTEVYIHLALRGATAMLALAAVAFGVLRAVNVRGDWCGACCAWSARWCCWASPGWRCAMRSPPSHAAPRPRPRVEAWAWLVVDALLPVFFLLLIEGWRRRDALEARLAEQSETDPLTGLPNRRGFAALAGAALAAARRQGAPCVVVALRPRPLQGDQ